ncbi:MAG: hypothetical protein RLY71_403 [Pseudomonadota bacterium]|jgi:hydroxybutyrate-dimer hydrolase
MSRQTLRFTAVAVSVLALASCGGTDDEVTKRNNASQEQINTLPAAVRGSVQESIYDGASDDLLTGGLGLAGLKGAAPAYADPAAPTATELRRNAIYNNYRALIDPTVGGGFGTLYGPNVDTAGAATGNAGLIAGREYIAWADDGTGRQNVTLMVQVPNQFDPARPCIVTATSSGSRGIYGAVATSGEWGLKHGCAVAYTDKGSGNGLHDPAGDVVMRRNGTTTTAAIAGLDSIFTLPDNAAVLNTFKTDFPNRVAYKHAHSQQNPEKDWGKNTLDAIRLAFYVLNERYGAVSSTDASKHLRTFTAANTLVIASSVSNGGGAALAAAEQDTEGLIDGVAVSEPNAQPGSNTGLLIQQGSAALVQTHSKPLIDYFTYANIFQPCAALSSQTGSIDKTSVLFWPAAYTTSAQQRCAALKSRGLLAGADTTAQADEALAKLHAYGWQREQDFFHQSHFRFATNSIVVTYVNSYGKFSVTDNVCGYSMANTNATGDVIAQVPGTQVGLFANGTGIPPITGGGINIVYNGSEGGAKQDFLAISPTSRTTDFALDGALCMRSLVLGKDAVSGAALTGVLKVQSDRVITGLNQVQLTARLQGKPTVIVAGRTDTLLPLNHTARAYYGKSQLVDAGNAAKVHYYEVTNAQHFDSFIGIYTASGASALGYDTRVVPLHPYLNRALDLMYAHLQRGQALPPSQVVRTVPRVADGTGVVAALTLANVPPIAATPAAADLITMNGATLKVPD